MLLKHLLDKELEARALGKPHQIAFFLVRRPVLILLSRSRAHRSKVASVTLVFQQHAVLECNLDQKIEPLCGPMGCDLWNKEQWATIFAENMVIVCTAEILYQCLVHSFLTMKQISLLIFDEAHHTKKGHSYAKLVTQPMRAQSSSKPV